MQKDSTYEGDTNQDDTFDQGENAPDQHTYSEDMPQEPTVDDSHPVENQREKRKRSRPKHLKDFIVNPPPPPSVDHASPRHPRPIKSPQRYIYQLICISYKIFTDSHKVFLAAVSSSNEPKHFNQVVQDVKWREAMQKEINALEENGTWTLEKSTKWELGD